MVHLCTILSYHLPVRAPFIQEVFTGKIAMGKMPSGTSRQCTGRQEPQFYTHDGAFYSNKVLAAFYVLC